MKRFIALGAAIFLCASVALGAVLHATWTNATANTDASAIPASGPGSIASSELEYGTCNTAKDAIATVSQIIPVAGQGQTMDSPDLPPGDWCAHVRNINTYGAKGLWSDVKSKTIAPPTPGKVTNFTW